MSRKVVHVVRSTMLTPLQSRTNQPPFETWPSKVVHWIRTPLATFFCWALYPPSKRQCNKNSWSQSRSFVILSILVKFHCRMFSLVSMARFANSSAALLYFLRTCQKNLFVRETPDSGSKLNTETNRCDVSHIFSTRWV